MCGWIRGFAASGKLSPPYEVIQVRSIVAVSEEWNPRTAGMPPAEQATIDRQREELMMKVRLSPEAALDLYRRWETPKLLALRVKWVAQVAAGHEVAFCRERLALIDAVLQERGAVGAP